MSEWKPAAILRADWRWLVILIALVVPLRLWLLWNTEVAARDSVGYIRYALQFEQHSWRDVVKNNHQHPGYSFSIWLLSQPVRALDGAMTPENMSLSARLVSFLASLTIACLMYLLGRQFFDAKISLASALLYQYFPISAHHLSDGISEPIYLVFLLSGLLQMVIAVRDRSALASILCGAFAGTAYLVRPEGLLIAPAFCLAMALTQFRAEWRVSWGRWLLCNALMVIAAFVILSIYVSATGRLTNKPSVNESLKTLLHWIGISFGDDAAATWGSGTPLFAASYAPTDSRSIRLQRSVWALIAEVCQGIHYVVVTAILGGLWSFAELRRHASAWALAIYAVIHSVVLVALAMSVFYVSDRHCMILVMGSAFLVVVGLCELPRRVLSRLGPPGESAPWYRSASVWFVILYVALLAACLPKATQRLHANRVGNREAGLWLKAQLQSGDVIDDDHAWSHYYSGLMFEEGREPAMPADAKRTHYIVTTRSRDPEIDAQRQNRGASPEARVVYTWPPNSDPAAARVIVYAQPRDPKTRPWRVAP